MSKKLKPNAINYRIIGDEREREMLGYIRQTRMSDAMQDVRDPDYHINAEVQTLLGAKAGRLKVEGLEFDGAWVTKRLLLELDGGQ